MSETAREYVDHYFDGGPYDGELFLSDLEAAGFVIVPKEREKRKTLDILRLDPYPMPIYFVVEGFGTDQETNTYRYEEGSCPTNFIPVEQIIVDGDTDPHGLFDYIKTIDRPAILDQDHNPEEVWRELLPEAFSATPQEPKP